MNTQVNDIADRVAAIEASNRRWKRFTGILILGGVLLVAMGPAEKQIAPRAPVKTTSNPKGTIEARQFRVVNQKGDVKIVLATNTDGRPIIQLFDDDGFQTLILGVDDAGQPNMFLSKQGMPMVWAGCWSDRQCGAIETYNRNGVKAAAMGSIPSNDGGLWRRTGDKELLVR